MTFPIYGNSLKKHVPNHQPVAVWFKTSRKETPMDPEN